MMKDGPEVEIEVQDLFTVPIKLWSKAQVDRLTRQV